MAIQLQIRVSAELEAEQFPLCPYCDQPLQNANDLVIVYNGMFSVMALAHQSCHDENDS
ncbi:hypothetical protein [Vibrio phage R01]|nr:hypothetical protein [Vibrio phage R01]